MILFTLAQHCLMTDADYEMYEKQKSKKFLRRCDTHHMILFPNASALFKFFKCNIIGWWGLFVKIGLF